MLLLFAITSAPYRWDQAQWEANNGMIVNDHWSVEVADAYEGYPILVGRTQPSPFNILAGVLAPRSRMGAL
jgi:hypothetical protein